MLINITSHLLSEKKLKLSPVQYMSTTHTSPIQLGKTSSQGKIVNN